MKKKIAPAVILFSLIVFMRTNVVYPVTTDSNEQSREISRIRVYALEGIGSVVGRNAIYRLSLLAFYCVKQYGYDVDEFKWMWISYGAGVLLGPPIGVGLTGRMLHQKSSYLGALVASAIGTGALMYYWQHAELRGLLPLLLNFTVPYISPIIGYNYKTFKDDVFAMSRELFDFCSHLPDLIWSKEGLFGCIVLLGLAGVYLM